MDSNLSCESHVQSIEKTHRTKIWILRQLKQAGWDSESITKIYTTSIRSCIEYASNIYYSFLNTGQAQRLENLQKRCLRIIYGWEKTYEDLLNISGLATLRERRDVRMNKFVMKAEANEKLRRAWFKVNEKEVKTRKRDKYVQETCRTSKQACNPVHFYTERLNRIYRL